MTARAPKLRIEGLAKQYGSVVALADTDITVAAGEFLTLLGPSGSGKTTLLMAIAGLVTPDRGRIWVDGQDATDRATYDRDVGMVFQNYALFPHLDVFENVAFPLRMRGAKEADIAKRTREALALVHLEHLIARYPRELSGGQQQRVAIARSVIYQPSIILMDEPLGALDKRLREQMQREIRRIHRQLGVTIVYVTHDQEEALSLSDRICLMSGGRIEQLGTPAELYFAPASLFAANFLGDANILQGSRPANGADNALSVAGGHVIRAAPRTQLRGQSFSVLVRPESLSLEEPGTHDNSLDAKVLDITMIGPLTQIDLVCDDGTSLVAKVPTRTALRTLAVGDRIRAAFAIEDTIVLPET